MFLPGLILFLLILFIIGMSKENRAYIGRSGAIVCLLPVWWYIILCDIR